MTAPPVARFTREQFLRLPESSPGFRFELVDGELVTMNDPLPLHQVAVGALHAELRAWCRVATGRGRVLLSIDTEIGPDTIVGPDLQWFAAERELPDLAARPWPAGDLVIEVASPSTARYDAGTKLARYLAAGAREVWLVSPVPLGVRIVRPDGERRVGVGGTLTSALLPGFELPVAALLD
ncbi:Uma2 family endonuclease [Patulibacter sp. NPDC049589]|uniref:Uma2 family endonuclease n=1 Tax=Patulibacter sp. NPDC049589 TaxID=3154731 RepID=UPI00343AC8BF